MMFERGDFTVTLPAGSVLRPDGTSTCPKTHGGDGDHFFIRNRDRTAFSCACGARAARRAAGEVGHGR